MSLSSSSSRLTNNSTTLHGQLTQTCTIRVFGFVTLLSLVHLCLGQLQACYYYNGVQNTNDVPCDPDASNSACCGPLSRSKWRSSHRLLYRSNLAFSQLPFHARSVSLSPPLQISLLSPLLFSLLNKPSQTGCLTIHLTPTTSQTAATAHSALITTTKAAATPARASNYSPTQTQLPYQVRQTI